MISKVCNKTARRCTSEEKSISYLLASPKTTGSKHLTVMLAEYQVGADHELHTHNPEQIYYIVQGSGEITVSGETTSV